MGPKKNMMSIDLKREIIEKHEQGARVRDLARLYGRSTSMICTVLKRKELIKGLKVAKGVQIISKLRSSLHDEMEKLLMEWVTEKKLRGGTLTQNIVCEKARTIFSDLLKQNRNTCTNEEPKDLFKASRGWFDNFRKRTGILSVKYGGEEASLDVKNAEKETDHYAIPECPNIVQNIIEEHNNYKEYYHDQFEVTEEEEQKHNISNTPTLQESSFERLHDSDNCDLNENSKVNEERYDVFGKTVAIKLKEIRNNKQRLLAEKLINDTLFLAELGELTSVHCIIENNSQVNHFLMSHVNNSSDSSNLNHIDDNKLSEVYIKEEIEDS